MGDGTAHRDRSEVLRRRAYAGIAHDLREFGYPDVTSKMIEEIHAAWEKGTKPLPHGVIGVIVGGRLDENTPADVGGKGGV